MVDLYGIVAVCTKPGKDGLHAVAVSSLTQQLYYDRRDAEERCAQLNLAMRPAQVLQYEVVEGAEWDRLAIQQELTKGNAWL